jgi:periplasmic protein TonB
MVDPAAPRKPLLPPHLVKPLAIAFGVGLLLFLLLWLEQRNDNDFFRAGNPETTEGSADTLPAPLPADVASEEGNASGLRLPDATQGKRPAPATGQPRIIDEPPPPPPAPDTPVTTSAPIAAASGRDTPVPISQPAPRYPNEALRHNDGGTVRVRVTVATDGSVDRLEVAESSGNRYLDRAATEAVRRWRFQPAVRDGQPVVADVVVPIVFNTGG